MSTELLLSLPHRRERGEHPGITSVCSAHPDVIRAALAAGRDSGQPVLIEATCNQVNHEGGYTGMTPADFRRFVEAIASEAGFSRERLILGGDHLGPNPWKQLPAEAALEKAGAMIAAYAAAGFSKIHLDCSMGCAGEPEALDDEVVARRAAELAAIAEAHAVNRPVYIIGTEVPVPGGASHEVDDLQVTAPEAARNTVEIHRAAFAARMLGSAFERVVGLVVQPGVEFGNANVVAYAPERARALSESLKQLPGMVFEAHSTDYQTRAALASLVRDGFAILKVGPGLTFALREALYSLDLVAAELAGTTPRLKPTMEALMIDEPAHWSRYYHGNLAEQRLQRHFSYSDRIRYYWTHARAKTAVAELMAQLGDRPLPETLVSQYFAADLPDVRNGTLTPTAARMLQAAIQRVLSDYVAACAA